MHASVIMSLIPADYLVSRCQTSLDCMDRLHSTREAFLADSTGEVIQFSFVWDALYVLYCSYIISSYIISHFNWFYGAFYSFFCLLFKRIEYKHETR